MIILVIVFGFFSFATTALRIGIRVLNGQQGWDDLTIAISTILLLIQMVFNGLQYHSGFGRHIYYLSKSQMEENLKWSYMTEFFIFIILCMTKVSVCLFILRMKKTEWLECFLYCLLAGLVATTIPCEIVVVAQCQPIHGFWDRRGTCWNPAMNHNVIWVQVGGRFSPF